MCFYEGKEYFSDVAKIINKFDIYICELGDMDDPGTLGKTRPCVIVSSDLINCPKSGQYMIAPIRSEHTLEVSRDTLNNIVVERRKVGRIYVPIEMNPDDFSFIDITQTRQISTNNIQKYCGTIINDEVRKGIDFGLSELLFGYVTKPNNIIQPKEVEICEDVETKNEVVIESPSTHPVSNLVNLYSDSKKDLVTKKSKTNFHLGFSLYYRAWAEGKMKATEIAEKCNVHISTVYTHIRKYHELHPEIQVKVKTKMFKD